MGAYRFVVEDHHVCLGSVDVGVAEQPGDDVDGESAGDRLGGEDPSEVVWGVVEGLTSRVLQPGAGQRLPEQLVHGALADHLPVPAMPSLEQMRRRRSGDPFVVVVAGG